MNTTGAIYARGNNSQVAKSVEVCQKYLPDLTSDDIILDIGCGTGEVTNFLAERSGAKVTGIDNNPDLIQYAKLNNDHANIHYELVDAQVKTTFTKYIIKVTKLIMHSHVPLRYLQPPPSIKILAFPVFATKNLNI